MDDNKDRIFVRLSFTVSSLMENYNRGESEYNYLNNLTHEQIVEIGRRVREEVRDAVLDEVLAVIEGNRP